jgi:uncharacterized delta-60 repeat protein
VVTGNLGANLIVARLAADGSPDPSFAPPNGPFGPGVLVDDLAPGSTLDRALGRDVALRSDGRIVVSGDLLLPDPSNPAAQILRPVAIAAQYDPAGSRDSTFGTGGFTPLSTAESQGAGVAIDQDGNVVVAGTARVAATGSDVLVGRLRPDGTPDPGFGTNGVVTTHVSQIEVGNALALAPDQKLVVAGTNTDTRGDRVLTLRYEPGEAEVEPPRLEFDPATLVFPERLGLTTSPPLSVTVTNRGTTPVTVARVLTENDVASDFAFGSSTCRGGVILPPGGSCQISMTFTPKAAGARTATLVVDHSGASSPGRVPLQGTGAAPTLVLNPAVVAPGQITTVTGTNWPAGQPMTMAWLDPVTGGSVGFPEPSRQGTPGAGGNLTATMVMFPNTTIGGRQLVGTVGAFTASVPVLVSPGSAQPGDFVSRR